MSDETLDNPPINNGKDMLERMAGFHPETKRMVEELALQGLGRTIAQRVSEKVDATNLSEEQIFTKTIANTQGLEYTPKTTKEISQTLGIILPCNKDNNEHVVILIDGSVSVIKPIETLQASQENYSNQTNPSETAFKVWSETTLSELRHIIVNENNFPGSDGFYFELVASSDKPEQKDIITSKVKTALEMAREIKTEREKAVQNTADEISGIYKELFHPFQPPQPQPPELPQQE